MRMHARNRIAAAASAITVVLAGQQSAWANVYASGVKLFASGVNPTITSCTPIGFAYVLNEDADGTPGVTIKVKKASDNTAIRTVTFTNPPAPECLGLLVPKPKNCSVWPVSPARPPPPPMDWARIPTAPLPLVVMLSPAVTNTPLLPEVTRPIFGEEGDRGRPLPPRDRERLPPERPGEERGKGLRTEVAEGGVAEVVAEGDGLGEVLVEGEGAGGGSGDLGHLERVGEPNPVVVALW